MAIRTTLVFKRPDTSIAFDEMVKRTSDLENYWQTNYRDTGKITDWTRTDSEDGLTRTLVITWKDEASSIEFVKDSTIQAMLNHRDSYNIENGISFEKSTEEI